MKKFIKTLYFAAFALATLPAVAQNGVNSPYSRYGFGMMADRSLGFNKAMGGVAQGFRNGQQPNPANPASYSAVDSLTALFDLGLTLHNGNYKMGNLQQNARNTSFDYFAFQFRAWRNVGMAVGILPYTNIDYDFSSQSDKLEGNENITSSYTFSGTGGLHKVFFGTGWRVVKPFSIGFNLSYLYGDYSHTSTMSFSQSSAYSMVRGYAADIATYMAELGVQYEIQLDKKSTLTIGATYGLGHDVKNRAYRNTQTLSSSSTVEGQTSDTLSNAFQLPHTFAVGASYTRGNQWRAGADFELEKWSQARFPSQDNTTTTYISTKGQLYDRMKLSVGGEYTPNVLAKSLLKRISYRAGAYYSQSYAKADVTGIVTDKPHEFGLTAGFSIPIANRNVWYNSPRINVALQWIHSDIPYLSSQSMQQNQVARQQTLTENYLKLSLGVTFSERWFYKWKAR